MLCVFVRSEKTLKNRSDFGWEVGRAKAAKDAKGHHENFGVIVGSWIDLGIVIEMWIEIFGITLTSSIGTL